MLPMLFLLLELRRVKLFANSKLPVNEGIVVVLPPNSFESVPFESDDVDSGHDKLDIDRWRFPDAPPVSWPSFMIFPGFMSLCSIKTKIQRKLGMCTILVLGQDSGIHSFL